MQPTRNIDKKNNFDEFFELMKESKVLLSRIHNVLREIREGDFWNEYRHKIEETEAKLQELEKKLL